MSGGPVVCDLLTHNAALWRHVPEHDLRVQRIMDDEGGQGDMDEREWREALDYVAREVYDDRITEMEATLSSAYETCLMTSLTLRKIHGFVTCAHCSIAQDIRTSVVDYAWKCKHVREEGACECTTFVCGKSWCKPTNEWYASNRDKCGGCNEFLCKLEEDAVFHIYCPAATSNKKHKSACEDENK